MDLHARVAEELGRPQVSLVERVWRDDRRLPLVATTSSEVVTCQLVFESEPQPSEKLLRELASAIEAGMTPEEIEAANLAIEEAIRTVPSDEQ